MSLQLDTVIDLFEDRQIEWPDEKSTHFLPASVLEDGQLQTSMLRELQGMLPSTSELQENQEKCQRMCTAAESSRKLLAIYFYVSEKDGQAILDVFDEGLRDIHLPLTRIYRHEGDRRFYLARKGHSSVIQKMQHWSQRRVTTFYAAQWKLLAPVFQPDPNVNIIPHHDLEDSCLLPFTHDESHGKNKIIMEGGYSEVWRVKIHQAHQNFYQATDSQVR